MFVFACTEICSAQAWNAESIEWYNDTRIKVSDRNNDGELQLNEIVPRRTNFLFYLNQSNFKKTDIDQSNSLNQRELIQHFTEEQLFMQKFWREQLDKLTKAFGEEQLNNKAYLKRNAGLLKQLLQNNVWLRKNDQIVEEIFEDKEWVEKHRTLIRAFSNNIYYFASNPRKAIEWYKQPQMGKGASEEFKILRQLHIKYLNKNPKFKKAI